MKKILLLMSAVVVVLFTACQKETLTNELCTQGTEDLAFSSEDVFITESLSEISEPEALLKRKKIKVEDLLPEILTFVKTKYADATILEAYKDDQGNFYVMIKDTEGAVKVLTFDKSGAFVKESTMPEKNGRGKADSIRKNIRTYISANYPGASVGHIQKNKDGSINVTVKTKDGKVIVLNFDKNGNFVKIVTISSGGGQGGGIDSVVVNNIKTYLTTNYPDGGYSSIERGKDGTYSVTVKNKDGKVTIVYFDKDGKFIKVVSPTTSGGGSDDAAISSIKAYLNANYTEFSVGTIEKTRDGGFTVMVKSKDGKVTTLYFDKTGKFIKAVPQSNSGGGTGTIDPKVLSSIKSYLFDNFNGSTFGDISPAAGGGYTVVVKTADGKVFTVVFDRDGKFVKVTP